MTVLSPPCHNHQDWHHYHCCLFHPPPPPPPLYPMQSVHLLMWTLEDDPSRGSPSSKVTGSSTSSLRSKLANANSTLLFKPLSSENTSHIFVFPFNHSSLCLYIRQRLVCTYTTKSLDTMTKRRVQQKNLYLSEVYIFTRVVTEEFNNQCHQHRGT